MDKAEAKQEVGEAANRESGKICSAEGVYADEAVRVRLSKQDLNPLKQFVFGVLPLL